MCAYQRHIVGREGENIAARWLIQKGFSIVARNYRKKWGEIDVIARKEGVLHFVEVKTVSRRGVEDSADYRPEENIHPQKLRRLHRTIETYLIENYDDEPDWRLDGLCVIIDPLAKTARVRFLEGIV